jgi:hypothetical protein
MLAQIALPRILANACPGKGRANLWQWSSSPVMSVRSGPVTLFYLSGHTSAKN